MATPWEIRTCTGAGLPPILFGWQISADPKEGGVAVRVGDVLPPIELRTLDGEARVVGGGSRQPRLLFMWASW